MIARFWTLVNGSPVKLTLAPDQTLQHTSGGATDEGYSWECAAWSFDGQTITHSYHQKACDCDGPIEHWSAMHCELAKLHTGFDEGAGIRYPSWEQGEHSQRDHNAERAGY